MCLVETSDLSSEDVEGSQSFGCFGFFVGLLKWACLLCKGSPLCLRSPINFGSLEEPQDCALRALGRKSPDIELT